MAGADFGVNLGAGIATNLVCGVVQEARYGYRFDTLVASLGVEQDKLKLKRDSMLIQVEKAKADTQEPSGDLQQQLEEAEDLLNKVEKLKRKAKASKSCCHGVCPNWICRYIVGKQAARMTEEMKQLNENFRQKLLSAHRLSLQPMPMSEDFIIFKCTEVARHKILVALKDDEKIRIGLHGMGGCGKSSLLKEVHKAVKDLKLFQKTAFVVVSNSPNIPAIQDSIASWLGLKFETEKNVHDRAARLSMAFEDDKKYLIVLDDVWEVLNFEVIGIPCRKTCKVLLSTRQQQICMLMGCQEVIHLSLLTKEEAWNLFQKHAGEIKDTFKKEAQEISDECHRLPVAIKAVASTLKGKSVFEWKDALETLKDRRPLDIEEGLENPYRCLKFSYDALKNKERSLFLLCALFPEDSKISREILIIFAFGLDIFVDVDSYEKARRKVGVAIDKIKDCSLLLQSEEEEHVEMHDLVRDVALLIANKKTQVIMGPKQNLKALIETDSMKDTTRLYCHDINEFPDQLNCPKLEILFVSNHGERSFEFPDTLFEEVKELKVLVIENRYWKFLNLLLPKSIEELKKLRTLCFRGWTLDNISILGKLEILHTIELLFCVMKKLPTELVELRKLKLLKVSRCRIGGNPYEVLARCPYLEELYFVKNYVSEMVSNDQNVVELFHQIGHAKVLQRYHLEIGSSIDTLKDDSTSKFISINDFNASTSNEVIQDLARKVDVLFLKKIQGNWKNIIPDMIQTGEGCTDLLTEFVLCDSDNIECLIDTTDYQARIVLSKLLKLKIEAVNCLEVLCRGPPPSGLFEKLEELYIMKCSQLHYMISESKLNLFNLKFLKLEYCPKLTFVFTSSTAQTMVLLEVLKVRYCTALKHIITEEGEDDTISVGPMFPKLKKISVKGCKHLECIILASFAGGLSQLEILKIKDARELKHVLGKYDHEKDQNQNQSIHLPVLKVFKLIDLPNIISICPQNYHIVWPSLDKLHIVGCPQLRGVSDKDSEVRQQGGDKATKQARLLSVSGGEDLRINFWAGIAKDLVQAVALQARYCYRFNTLVTDLGKEKAKLRSTRESMAKANPPEPSGDLQQQLKEAEDLIENVEMLEGKAEASKSYCRGVCPNWIRRYIVGKRLARMTEAARQLNERLASNRLSLRPTVKDSTSEKFCVFESRKKAHDELLMALKDDEINMIGIYGMRGCGKTSLVIEVGKAAKNSKLFDEVVYVMVSGYPNITTIQRTIAACVGFYLEGESELERAASVSWRLNYSEKFLIILDDIGEVVKLEDIGIPLGENCKVLLSSRQRRICTIMDCQKVIYVSLVSKEEGWFLFRKHAGVIEDRFKVLAQEITDKCEGLLVAITSVACTLKGKPAVVWEEALKTLRDYKTLDIESGLENPYKCLKLSFDNLEDEVRSLFILCALFPGDSNIALEILIRFAFGLGIFEDVFSYERARSKVHAAIGKLKDCSLLQQAEEGQVGMCSLVHDVALWLAKETRVIMGPRQNLKALAERDYMKDTIRLYCHEINEYPDKLNCPKLEILFVSKYVERSFEFPDTLFKGLLELKVLAIENTSFMRNPILLPQSVEELKKLRTLCLSRWTLDDISIFGKLEIINTIVLSYCAVKELPKELAKLRELKLLEVSSCRIGGNPYEVLARCSQLEELYFVGNNSIHMLPDNQNVAELVHQIGSSKVLKRYHLEIGRSIDTLKNDLMTKFISINNFNASTSNEVIQDLTQKVEVLFLKKVRGHWKNIIPDMIPTKGRCMSQLTEFVLCDSDNIECFIDTTNHQLYQTRTVFSKLVKLKIEAMESLKALCHGQPPSGFFEKLEELFIMECSQLHFIVSVGKLNLCGLKLLKLEDCPKLTSVFTSSTAQNMVLLEVLKVRDCTALEHIIKDEEDEIISVRPLFPKLKHVSVKRCEHLECIIPASFAGGLSQLESLKIEDAPELKHVFGKYNQEDKNQNQSIDLPVLKVFKLVDLLNIISICPHNYHITWPSLDELHIMGCPQLSGISDLDSVLRRRGGDKATKQEFGLPAKLSSQMEGIFQLTEPANDMESKLEDWPQEHENPEEGAAAAEEEHFHDDDGEDKDGREEEEEQPREEESAVQEDSSNVIEQSTRRCVESREVDEAVVENPSVGNYSLPSTTASGTAEVDAIDQDKEEVSSHTALTCTKEGRGFSTVTSTIQDDNLNEENQRSNDDIASAFNLNKATGSDFHSPKQDSISDLQNEVQGAADVHLQSQKFDAIVDTQESLQEQNFYPVGSMNSRESNTEVAKGSLHKDPAPEVSKVGASSCELVEKLPHIELELLEAVTNPQDLQGYTVSLPLPVLPTVLSPGTSITTGTATTEAPTSSSTKQHLLAEELADFHGLSRRARLLDEAFVKYPHLWNWKISQKAPRFCKWGYKSLADMLAFLKSEKPKAMDDSKRKKFEDLCVELESFGFDKEWLASIRQRVMDMQVDHDDKLEQLAQLESEVSTLHDQLNVARARMARIKDDLSKLDDVFGL